MERERFEELVERAIGSLPQEFLDRLDNVEIMVEDYPTPTQMRKAEVKAGHMLLGIYEGVPRTRRSTHYGMVLPDKITVFKKPIEAKCRTDEEITAEIERVVRHEIAHHFGLDDARLDELGR
ncbi:MAG: metallopeptidase family protein [Dehalococcoidia bacterium]|nr:metallopeptidase family protein [Dehalococcoidia bacterium]